MPTKKSKRNSTARPKAKRAISRAPEAPRRGIVFVHGGGEIPKNYHESLMKAINKQLPAPIAFVSAFYSDVMSQSAQAIGAKAESPEMARFRKEYAKQLQLTRARVQEDHPTRSAHAQAIFGIDNSLTDAISEVIGYLTNANYASKVQARVIDALDQAAREFDEIVVVSHSLGTIVSYDILKKSADRYKVAHWFTLGCPLAKLARTKFRDGALGKITLANVARWHNVYDTNDIVADPISAFYFSDQVHVHDIFVEIASAMPEAHDYFGNAQVQTMLAEAMK